MSAVSYCKGEKVLLRGEKREYRGTVEKAGPDTLEIRIGESWNNVYHLVDGTWIGVPRQVGRKPATTSVVGLIIQGATK